MCVCVCVFFLRARVGIVSGRSWHAGSQALQLQPHVSPFARFRQLCHLLAKGEFPYCRQSPLEMKGGSC